MFQARNARQRRGLRAHVLAAALALPTCAAPGPDTQIAADAEPRGLVAGMQVAHREAEFDVPTFIWLEPGRAPDAGSTAPEVAWQILRELAPTYRLGSAALSATRLRTLHDTGRGTIIAHFEQELGELPVFALNMNVALDRALRPVAATGYLAPRVQQADAAFHLTEAAAKSVATTAMRSRGEQVAGVFALPAPDARVRRILYARPAGLVPSYYLELDQKSSAQTDSELRAYVVSAVDGSILFEKDLTAADSYSYRVWADKDRDFTPWDGPQGDGLSPHPTGKRDGTMLSYVPAQLVTLPNLPFSRNDPWLPPGATEARGNNAVAYADIVAPDGLSAGDIMLKTSAPGVFDYALDVSTQDPAGSATAMQAVTTNFFYTLNWLHDQYYAAGWDEGSYNPQQDNYGRGGVAGDPIRAEAQDVSGRNNANASTPADGSSPRIQMYLWDPTRRLRVTAPSELAGDREISSATFGPRLFDVQRDVVLVDDGTGTLSDGCETPFRNAPELAGKIALIDRSSCAYHTVTYNAQQNGAVGVVFVNNAAGAPVAMRPVTPPPPMPVTIPAMMIRQSEGASMKSALAMGKPVNLHMQAPFANNDSSLDATIIAHEWGHVLSNRLVGNSSGLGNTQGSGMGEGWSDFVALLTIIKPEDASAPANANWTGVFPVAAYSAGPGDNAAYDGIRRYPYSADLMKAPLTYKHIQNGVPLPAMPAPTYGLEGTNNAEVHNTGEVWTNLLFDCYVALLRDGGRYSFAQAHRAMRDYLVASLKLTPINPTILEARDALLAAAYANSAEDYELFVQAFARRGAGLGAVGPDRRSNDNKGVTESFRAGADFSVVAVTLDDAVHSCDHDGILDNDEVGRLRVTLRNTGSIPLEAFATLASSHPAVTDSSGGQVAFPTVKPYSTTNATLLLSMKGAPMSQPFDITLTLDAKNKAAPGAVTIKRTYFGNYDVAYGTARDDSMDDPNPVWNIAFDAKLDVSTPWAHAGDKGLWSIPDAASPSDHYLVSPPLEVDTSGSFGFTLRHRFGFEADATYKYDGAVIEISDDGGMTWTDVEAQLISNGYNGTLWNQNAPLGNRRAFTAQSTGHPAFIETQADFGATYQGKTVRLRFRVGTDPAAGGPGWDLDELRVTGIKNKPFATRTLTHTDCKNHPPIVTAGEALRAAPGELVTLRATAMDPDGDLMSYRFTQQSGPAVMLSDYQILEPTFTAPQVGEPTELTFALVANDGTVDSAPAIVRVQVAPPGSDNPPPMRVEPLPATGCAMAPVGETGGRQLGASVIVALLIAAGLLRRRAAWLLLAAGCSGAQPPAEEVPLIPFKVETDNGPRTPQRLVISRSGDGTGAVTTEPNAAADERFPYDTRVTLHARPDAQSIFAGWSGDCQGAALDCKVHLNIERKVTARFEPRLCSADGLCWERPFPQGNTLYAVQRIDGDHIYMAGAGGLILYKEGTRVRRMDSGTSRTLRALFAAADGSVFAVGEAGTITQLDGTRWRVVASGTPADLYAVWGSSRSDVWAVGDGGTALHFDGTSWTPRPLGAAADESLRGVHGSAADNVWVVSTAGNAYRFDGTNFTKSPIAQRRLLAVLTLSPSSAWAVGDAGTALQFDGTAWTSKGVSTAASLHAVSGSAGGAVWVASSSTGLYRRDDTTWKSIDNITETTLHALHGSANDLWMAGSRGAIARFDGAQLTGISSGTETKGFAAVWGHGPSSVWLVGAGGLVARADGASIDMIKPQTSADLVAIHGASDHDIWAVGENGTTLHATRAGWKLEDSGTPQRLFAVYSRNEADTWAVGELGVVLHHDGTRWQHVATGAQSDLYAVWTSGPMDVWVGGERELLHYDGKAWRKSSAPRAPIYALAGRFFDDVWAAGAGGALDHFDGAAWKSERAMVGSVTANLRAIALTSSDEIWIAAEGGVVLRGSLSKPAAMSIVASDSTANLYSVTAAGPRNVWLAGAAGVLSYRR